MQDLDVLPADINDRVHIGEEEDRAPCMARKLAHLLVGNVHQAVAAVAGGQHEGHVLAGLAGCFQHRINGALGAAGTGADGHQGFCHDVRAVFQHDALGGRGADVNAEGVNVVHGNQTSLYLGQKVGKIKEKSRLFQVLLIKRSGTACSQRFRQGPA